MTQENKLHNIHQKRKTEARMKARKEALEVMRKLQKHQ